MKLFDFRKDKEKSQNGDTPHPAIQRESEQEVQKKGDKKPKVSRRTSKVQEQQEGSYFRPLSKPEDQSILRQEYPSIAEQYTASLLSDKTADGKPTSSFFKAYKPLVYKKLTIVLIENTSEVAQQKAAIANIVGRLVTEDLVCLINYGSSSKQSEIMEANELKGKKLFNSEDIGEAACLFDCLAMIESLVTSKLLVIQENEKERVNINRIEVIGIGTCKEQGSKVLKDFAIQCFARVAKNPKVVTKYFCLTEESFLRAAEIGFHSIGSISRKY